MDKGRRNRGLDAAAIVAVVFGLVTVKEGGTVLFGPEEARRAVGAYVPFVLWFNFLAGFAYVAAGVGLWARWRWAALLSFVVAAGTVATYAAFGVHVALGGAFETRTVAAMALRTALWLAISLIAWRWLQGTRRSAT